MLRTIKKYRDNYTKPTYGLGKNHFAYPWFKMYHLTHLRYDPFVFRNPPLLKSRVNGYFCSKFISLLPKQKIVQNIRETKSKSGIDLSLNSHKS